MEIVDQKVFKFFFSILGIGAILGFWFGLKIALWLIVIVLVALGGYLIYLSIGDYIIGGIDLISSKADEQNIICFFDINKNWSSINNISVWYEIREETEDSRGTSTTTYDELLYKSELFNTNNISNKITSKLNLPPVNIPTSLELGCIKIYAVLNLKVRFKSGFTTKYFTDLKINKIPVKI